MAIRLGLFAALIFGAAACASHERVTPTAIEAGPGYTALGYLNPGMNGDPEIIGTYASEAECRAAIDYWMSRQVVGNPLSGDCLPVDRR